MLALKGLFMEKWMCWGSMGVAGLLLLLFLLDIFLAFPFGGVSIFVDIVAILACCAAHDCDAIDRVILEVGQLSTASVQAKDATITLDVSSHDSNPAVRAQLGKLHVPQTGATYSDVDVTCIDLLIKDPFFACSRGSLCVWG